MRTMCFRDFKRKLKKCNPDLIIKPGPGKTASILKHERGSEFDDGRNLHHLINMPNPRKFMTFTPNNWFEQLPSGRKELHRGWMDVVRVLVGQGYIRRSDAQRNFSLVRI